MSVQFSIDDRGLRRAMTTYAVMRNKSDADVVNKAMRYWLPFAAKRVKDKTPGAPKIRRELTKTANKISRGRKKKQEQLANTLAAALIASRLRKKGQILPRRQDADRIDMQRINDFYERVRRFVAARVRSANYLRAGFIPAFRQFSVPNRGVPGQNRFKGQSRGIKAVPSLTKTVVAFATNQREGAFKIAPNAFRHSIRDVQRQFLRWLRADVEGTAKRSGFG
jgi:hypothetical protein